MVLLIHKFLKWHWLVTLPILLLMVDIINFPKSLPWLHLTASRIRMNSTCEQFSSCVSLCGAPYEDDKHSAAVSSLESTFRRANLFHIFCELFHLPCHYEWAWILPGQKIFGLVMCSMFSIPSTHGWPYNLLHVGPGQRFITAVYCTFLCIIHHASYKESIKLLGGESFFCNRRLVLTRAGKRWESHGCWLRTFNI